MDHKLTPSTALLLIIPPFLWAGNAVVGRMMSELVPPITLNFLRWAIAFIILLPLGYSIFRKGSGLWAQRKRYACLGLLGIGLYNALQYMALHSSTPINVTLVGASMPMWMLLTGFLFFEARVLRKQVAGAALSVIGVFVVLSHGEWRQLLGLRFVIGDLFMIVATIVWAFYSWSLIQARDSSEVRRNWATFLLAQVSFGVVWSGIFAAGEWTLADSRIQWGWPLAGALAYVAIGPAIIAFRCWGLGVQRAGPSTAGFFNNLTPLFAALMSSAFLGEMPQAYHAVAFALIVSGIILSSRR
ncbi:DMT family transporter [Pollutimonas bauzanensis]|uniref:Permease of the drug/metabolite transporter (DMT) superfamily n=1 Tax=Pollutimonas bauzanensis TaxID=658167 RepID=A0A1M5YFA9_9BURK|nr:DMT family transporter [Pollutimonas bauzanensis]SHI10666.1 Permease of the drug/metabolite transporter (DMT) superfamily [Pollutimonas bauzanensis]